MKNPPSGRRVVPCGRTDRQKLGVAYRILQTRMTSECSGLRPAFQYIMHVETG